MITELDKIIVPESKIIIEAQDLVHEHGNELIWNHSNRVYLFGAVKGDQDKVKYDMNFYTSVHFSMTWVLRSSTAAMICDLKSTAQMLPASF